MDVAGGDEDVEVRPLGDPDRLDGPLRVAVAAAGERGHGDALGLRAIRWTASKSPGEAAGKPASMTSTLRRTSWRATSSFSAAVSAGAGRLLAVAQRGVEDPEPPAAPATAAGGYAATLIAAAPGRRWRAAWAWPASTTTGSRNGIWARSSAPTCSIWWSRSCCAQPLELRPAGVVLGDPARGEGARPGSRRGRAFIVALTCSSMIRGPQT